MKLIIIMVEKEKESEGERTLEEELGDVLFVVISMANALDIDLIVFQLVIE